MNNFVSNTVSNAISFVKNLRLERLFIVALAGFLLLVNTACSQTTASGRGQDEVLRSADTRGAASSSPYKGQARQQRELYDTVQPRKGGMNEYDDDFKQDSANAKARAGDLVNRSKQNLQKRADSPEQFAKNYRSGTPLDERVRNLTEDVTTPAKELGQNLSEGAQKGSQNIKENASNFRKDAPRVVEQAGRNAQEATRGVRESADDFSKGVERAADRASNFAQDRS
ncbi:hypothetical protein K9N68_21615 [Kovacikia minuta CCNUW1]|uniref:hypothetical protein n=1 Tax=Kovacikia minuta TaxID=2931930 RepID=UPI001CCF744A|nr:hypothetical protein [Kovacikia minuta]UBF24291.1 hypothetical protein K9N68_21615 [Kovacikia minuta CCNUW1]